MVHKRGAGKKGLHKIICDVYNTSIHTEVKNILGVPKNATPFRLLITFVKSYEQSKRCGVYFGTPDIYEDPSFQFKKMRERSSFLMNLGDYMYIIVLFTGFFSDDIRVGLLYRCSVTELINPDTWYTSIALPVNIPNIM